MARKPRIYFPGACYHVMLRGNGGDDIFSDNEERCRFYVLLQHYVERYGCRIHSFCLMSNHAHLALQIGTIPLLSVWQQIEQGHRKEFHGQSTIDGRVCGEDTFVGQVLNRAEQEPVVRPKMMEVIKALKRSLLSVTLNYRDLGNFAACGPDTRA